MTSQVISGIQHLDDAWKNFIVQWTANQIPDMAGKVAMVTGGNSGLGLECVRKLAENGAKVYMVSRLKSNGDKAVAEIEADLGKKVANRIAVLECDMSSLDNVDQLAKTFRSFGEQLHILALNAGVFHPGPYAQTPQGFEQTLGINYFAAVRLTLNLLDIVKSSGPSRIIFMGSHAEGGGKVDWGDMVGAHYKDSGMTPYSNSKLLGLMWYRELQDRLRSEGVNNVDVFVVQPGVTHSPLIHKVDLTYWTGALIWLTAKIMRMPVKTGATSLLYAASEPALTGKGFQYIGPNHMNMWHTVSRGPLNPTFKRADWRRVVFDDTISILRKAAGPPMSKEPHPVTKANGSPANMAKGINGLAESMPVHPSSAEPNQATLSKPRATLP